MGGCVDYFWFLGHRPPVSQFLVFFRLLAHVLVLSLEMLQMIPTHIFERALWLRELVAPTVVPLRNSCRYEGGIRAPFFASWPACLGFSPASSSSPSPSPPPAASWAGSGGPTAHMTVRATVRVDDLFATLLSLSYLTAANATHRGRSNGRASSGGRDAEVEAGDDPAWASWLAAVRAAAPDSRPLFNALAEGGASDRHRHHAHRHHHASAPTPHYNQQQRWASELSGSRTGPGTAARSVRWHELGSHSVAVQRGRFKLVASLALVGESPRETLLLLFSLIFTVLDLLLRFLPHCLAPNKR